MKGNERIIEVLNTRLAEELTAINQYLVHAEMCGNWGYDRLHGMIIKRTIDEKKHAERLIARIIMLEGKPVVGKLNKIHIGSDIPRLHRNDHSAEAAAIRGYNESIRLAVELGDNGSRQLLESILKEEEAHIDLIETQLYQVAQMGLPLYLAEQFD